MQKTKLVLNCVHDPWYKTDRLLLAIVVGFMVLVACAQAYQQGRIDGLREARQTIREARMQAFAAGFQTCRP